MTVTARPWEELGSPANGWFLNDHCVTLKFAGGKSCMDTSAVCSRLRVTAEKVLGCGSRH